MNNIKDLDLTQLIEMLVLKLNPGIFFDTYLTTRLNESSSLFDVVYYYETNGT